MGYKYDVTRGTAARGSSKLAMDKDHEVRDSDRSEEDTGSINSDAESDLDSDRVSASEESGDSSEELTGTLLAPYSFEPSDSDSASASPYDDDARDERLSDLSWYVVSYYLLIPFL